MSKTNEKQTSAALLPVEIRDAEQEVVQLCPVRSIPWRIQGIKLQEAVTWKASSSEAEPLCWTKMGYPFEWATALWQVSLLWLYDFRWYYLVDTGVTKLIVKHYHEQANHSAGTNFVLSQVNEKFWIVAAHGEIREWEEECNTCKRMRNKTATQIMAPLPKIRLRFTFCPFDQTSVDYGWPFHHHTGMRCAGSRKVWLCLFTCLSTRAVHLEMSFGLDTDSFLNAFTHFTSISQGVPKEMV